MNALIEISEIGDVSEAAFTNLETSKMSHLDTIIERHMVTPRR